ncbi:patatin-like phospholipase family protein [Frondihabitans australicus]|uniref:NTE family protein n=1 Tax=Frondihabitans australicus TaxID=386892 RepID=A0A495IGD0_9MICO|nr:patatin-like phospholipase family protein [Frondihabitans australicus]RKR74391.1 NTE family protein [Frondihabitans australicus]
MTDAPTPSPRRAVVLGGGGIAGIAWHLGVLSELLDQGIDLGAADLVVGTSAGSVAGSILRFGQVPLVYAMQAAAPGSVPAEDAAPGGPDMATFSERVQQAVAGFTDAQDARARLGRAAIDYSQGAESPLLGQLAAQFPAAFGWPAAPLGVTVVDATTGEFRVLDASSGVELPRAVAASCSVPLVFPPVEIDGVPYVDGGVRSATNADVASGYDSVLVLACGPEDPANPLGPQLDAAVATLRGEGSEVHVIVADDESIAAFGANSLSDESRVPSALAGRRQGGAVAAAVREFWG